MSCGLAVANIAKNIRYDTYDSFFLMMMVGLFLLLFGIGRLWLCCIIIRKIPILSITFSDIK